MDKQHLVEPKVPNQHTQNFAVLEHLRKYDHLTSLEAFGVYHIYRLASRVDDLKKLGWNITSERVRDPRKRPYARYRLDPNQKASEFHQPAVG